MPAKRAKKGIRLIEFKRAVSLAQFRVFNNYDDLCRAVVMQDKGKLNVDNILSLQALLPTAKELDSTKRHCGSTEVLGNVDLFPYLFRKSQGSL